MQILTAALIAVLVFLHYLLWIDEDGVRQTHILRITIQAQTEENVELAERNQGLDAEVKDLKDGLMAIEERARAEMGLIRPDETFYRFLEQPLPHHPNLTAPDRAALSGKPGTLARKPLASVAKPSSKPVKPAAKPSSTPVKPAVKPTTPPAKPVVKPSVTKPVTQPGTPPAQPALESATPDRDQ